MQNDALLANDFFFKRAGTEKPLLRRNEGGLTFGGPIVRNRTFFFGSYQATRAETSFVDEASNTVLLPAALTDDRSDAAIDGFATAIWNPSLNGPVNLAAINPISRSLLQARLPNGTFLVPSGSGGTQLPRRERPGRGELRGALGHSGDVRAGPVLVQPRSPGLDARTG